MLRQRLHLRPETGRSTPAHTPRSQLREKLWRLERPRRFRARATPEDGASDEPPALMGDWRQFRAKLVAEGAAGGEPAGWAARQSPDNQQLMREQHPSLAHEDLWAHATGLPEQGGLLVATPRVGADSPYWQAVVFLVQHDAQASVGVVLNRPLRLTVGQMMKHLAPGFRPSVMDMPELSSSIVYHGGMDGFGALIHGHSGVAGSTMLAPGIYSSNLEPAFQAVAAGELPASDVRLFNGGIMRQPGQLAAEVAAGLWQPAACSRALVLKGCLSLPVPLWVETTRLMGGADALWPPPAAP